MEEKTIKDIINNNRWNWYDEGDEEIEEEENTALISLLQRNLEVANKALAQAHKRILELTKDKYSGFKDTMHNCYKGWFWDYTTKTFVKWNDLPSE